jgi:hypothetical protein
MSCKTRWDLPFISSLGQAFYNGDFRRHLTNCLIVREKALLADPSTQAAVQRMKNLKALRKRYHDTLTQERVLRDQLRELEDQLVNCRNRKIQDKFSIDRIEREEERNSVLEETAVYSAPIHCAVPECRGFLDTKSNLCNVCSRPTCRKCLQPIDGTMAAAHVCDEAVLKENSLIRTQCKPCPKCGESISKTEGCDQMFCIRCKTAFSWNTGLIEKGRIHNPHYYELLRKENNGVIPREPGDNPGCEDEDFERLHPLFFHTLYDINHTFSITEGERLRITHLSLVRLQRHLDQVILPETRLKITKCNFVKMRAEYSLGLITSEEAWAAKVFQTSNKKRFLENILEMYETMKLLMRDVLIHLQRTSIDFVTTEEERTNQNLQRYWKIFNGYISVFNEQIWNLNEMLIGAERGAGRKFSVQLLSVSDSNRADEIYTFRKYKAEKPTVTRGSAKRQKLDTEPGAGPAEPAEQEQADLDSDDDVIVL